MTLNESISFVVFGSALLSDFNSRVGDRIRIVWSELCFRNKTGSWSLIIFYLFKSLNLSVEQRPTETAAAQLNFVMQSNMYQKHRLHALTLRNSKPMPADITQCPLMNHARKIRECWDALAVSACMIELVVPCPSPHW